MQAKQVRKSANNLASIAIFVAKSACKYVICNTYIPRVYILVYVNSTALIKIWSTSISQPCAPADKIGGFMNQKSGIGKHESINRSDILIHE